MDENLIDNFQEEMMNRFQQMTDAMQYFMVRLYHRFRDDNQMMNPDEKIKTYFINSNKSE